MNKSNWMQVAKKTVNSFKPRCACWQWCPGKLWGYSPTSTTAAGVADSTSLDQAGLKDVSASQDRDVGFVSLGGHMAEGSGNTNMIARLSRCALPVLIILVAACHSNATKSLAATPHGTRVEAAGGAYTTITPQELRTLLAHKHFALINVHIPYEGEIENTDAVIPYSEIDKLVDKLPSDRNAMVVLYCRSGPMSQKATEALVTLNYTNVWKLDRGMVGWKEAGFPIVTKMRP